EGSDQTKLTKYSWRAFSDVSEHDNFIILWFDRAQGVLVPARALANNDVRRQFVSLAREHGARADRGGSAPTLDRSGSQLKGRGRADGSTVSLADARLSTLSIAARQHVHDLAVDRIHDQHVALELDVVVVLERRQRVDEWPREWMRLQSLRQL